MSQIVKSVKADQEHLISSNTSVTPGSYQEVVAERVVKGNQARFFIKYTGADITAVALKVYLYFEKSGDAYQEPKVAGDRQTWSDREHTLPVNATGRTCVCDVELGGALRYSVQMNFTATSAVIADFVVVSHR